MRLDDTGRACHPKLRDSSLRHWQLDEAVTAGANDAARAAALVIVGGTSLPVVQSPTGNARRFSTAGATALAEAAADSESRSVLEGDWTVSVLVRPITIPGGAQVLVSYSGTLTDAANDPQNYMMTSLLLSDMRPSMFWEHSGGTNVQVSAATYVLPKDKVTLITWRKSNTTGPGDLGGTCKLELLVNGHVVDVAIGTGTSGAPSQTVTNTSHGSLARWRIGCEGDVVGAPTSFFNGDLIGVYAYAVPLEDTEIWEDVRRLYLLPFFSRTDVRFDLETQVDGVFEDMTNLEGVDWVDTVEINDEVDQPCRTGSVKLLREVGNLTLSVLRTDSLLNLTDPLDPNSYSPKLLEGRECELFCARVPLGIKASGSDWVSVIKGHVDEVQEGSAEAVVLPIRDEGGVLVDTFIEETVEYGAIPPVAVEGEMQFVLNDNDNDNGNNSVAGLVARNGSYAPITLYTPKSPGWAVTSWKQRREGVLAALRNTAGQTAWECRYKFDPAPSQKRWRLTFYDPDRLREDIDCVFLADDVLDIPRFSRSIFGVRNVFRVIYPSSETSTPTISAGLAAQIAAQGFIVRTGWNSIDGEGNRVSAFVELESPGSISLVGRRLFCEFGESSTGQIDTIDEAATMCFGGLLDLQEPPLEKGVRIPFMFEMELNDIHKFGPTILSTGTQRLAVKSLSHTLDGQSSTTVQLRGKPSLGFKRWLRLEARQGNARPGVMRPQDANSDVTEGGLLQVMRNLVDRTNAFKGGKFLQLRNPEFQQFTDGRQNPPDGWTPRASTWLTDMNVETVSTRTGNLAVRFLTSAAVLESDPVPVNGDFNNPISVELVWQRVAVGANFPQVVVEFLDSTLAVVGSYTLTQSAFQPAFGFTPTTAGLWFKSRADGVRPPVAGTARWVRLVIQNSGVFQQLLIDSASAYYTGRESNVGRFHQTPYAFGAVNKWYPIPLLETDIVYPTLGLQRYDWGNNLFVTRSPGTAPGGNNATVILTGEVLGNQMGDGFYVREDGTYQVTAIALIQATAASRSTTVRLMRNATYDAANNWNNGGVILQQSNVIPVQTKASFGSAFFTGGAYSSHGALHILKGDFQLQRGDRVSLEFYRPNAGVTWAAFAISSGLNQLWVKQKFSE